jgi:hypothetical protein
MKTCVIMQPTYLPWLGYFNLIEKSDVFVFLDHAQFSKQSWQQRNRIRDKNGELLLTVPVKRSNLDDKISSIIIDMNKNALTKHFKSIQLNYRKTKNYSLYIEYLEEIYSHPFEKLVDLNIELIKFGCKIMNIQGEFLLSSELDVKGTRVDSLIDICNKVKANQYLSPIGSEIYIEKNNIFSENNIELIYQNYIHPVYKQSDYPDFLSHLSFVDYIFNF